MSPLRAILEAPTPSSKDSFWAWGSLCEHFLDSGWEVDDDMSEGMSRSLAGLSQGYKYPDPSRRVSLGLNVRDNAVTAVVCVELKVLRVVPVNVRLKRVVSDMLSLHDPVSGGRAAALVERMHESAMAAADLCGAARIAAARAAVTYVYVESTDSDLYRPPEGFEIKFMPKDVAVDWRPGMTVADLKLAAPDLFSEARR